MHSSTILAAFILAPERLPATWNEEKRGEAELPDPGQQSLPTIPKRNARVVVWTSNTRARRPYEPPIPPAAEQ